MSARGLPRQLGRAALATAALVAIGLITTPGALLAHAHLTRSEPSSGTRVASAPTVVRLWFSEAPELAFTRLTLLGPDSAQVALGEVQRVRGEALAVSVAIRSALAAGEYTLLWQTAGADGHPSRGRFSFVVLPSPASHPQMMRRHAGGAPHTMGGSAGEEPGADSPAYVAVRWLSFVALLALIGVTVFRLLVLSGAARAADRHARGPAFRTVLERMGHRAARIGVAAAATLLATALARLYLQTVAMHGQAGAMDVAMMRQMVAQTHWGKAWLLQAAAGVVALLALVAALRTGGGTGRGGRAAWTVATAAVMVLAFTPALGGHAAAAPRLTALAIASDGMHVLSAGGWLGALLILLAVGLPVALAGDSPDRGAVVADLVNAFSPTALGFATLLVLTGLFAAWLHLGGLAALWGSTYGRTLLLKLGILIPVLGTGAYNWRRVRPALGDVAAAGRLRRSAGVELAVGGLVILVTAVLVAVQTPT